MTLDKFCRHISKRNTVDKSSLEKEIFTNIETKILRNFKSDKNYIENKIIQNVEQGLRGDFINLKKRFNDNESIVENASKRIKIIEEEFTKGIKENITNISESNDLLIKKIATFAADFVAIKKKNDDLEKNIENEITLMKKLISDTTTFDNVKQSLTKDFSAKFQTFTNMINDRVKDEIEHFKDLHLNIDKEIQALKRSTYAHNLHHKDDTDKLISLGKHLVTIENETMKIDSKIETLNALQDELTSLNNQINNIKDDMTKNEQNLNTEIINVKDMVNKNEQNLKLILQTDISEKLTTAFDAFKKEMNDKFLSEVIKIKDFEEEMKKNVQSIENIQKVFGLLEAGLKGIVDDFKKDVENLKNSNEYDKLKLKTTIQNVKDDTTTKINSLKDAFESLKKDLNKNIELQNDDLELNINNKIKKEVKLLKELIDNAVNDLIKHNDLLISGLELNLNNKMSKEVKSVKDMIIPATKAINDLNITINDLGTDLDNIKKDFNDKIKILESKINIKTK